VTIDLFTVSLVTALVVIVSGVLYLVETLLRHDGAAGRLWSVAFLAGILAVLSYLVWSAAPGTVVAVASGNGAFAASAGFMWLGARAFNGHRSRVAGAVVGIGSLAPFVAVLAAGPNGGDWAGAMVMFVSVGGFAGAAAVETRRGAMSRRWSALGLTIVLCAEAVFFAGRAVAFVAYGPESTIFSTWFGTASTSLVTIVLTIVAVVVTSVLRAGDSTVRGQRDSYVLHVAIDGIMLPASFRSAASTLLERAERQGETLCLIAVRIDDLRRVGTAFGPGEAEALGEAWRAGVRRHAPTTSLVGEGDDDSLLIAFVTAPFTDVRRLAVVLQRRVLDEIAGRGVSIVPTLGVGVAGTRDVGYDFLALADGAVDAARRSAADADASVVFATG
jgi:hypothetical protein